MLSSFFKLPEEVRSKLNSINHVSTEYSAVIVMLCRRFDDFMGTESVMDLRRNNNHQVLDRFNIEQEESKLRQEYYPDEASYSYFYNKLYDIFQLNLSKYSLKVEEYAKRQKCEMVDAFAPLMGCRESKVGAAVYNNYKELRKSILGDEKN